MEQPPKIGIVTVLYNSASVLDEFFATLESQTYCNFILYVIDNHSPDDSLAKARALSVGVSFETVVIAEPENWGVAKGNNIGIRRALADGCDYVLLSNNDTVLEPCTIASLLTGMQEAHATMAVPKIYFHGTDQFWYAGGRFDTLRCGTPHLGLLQADRGQYDTPCLTSYAPTCFMLVDRHVFSRVGLMDETYFVYYDDSDFVWRALREGSEKLAYVPLSRLWHKESTSTGGIQSDFYTYYIHRNACYFARRHFTPFRRGIFSLYLILHYILRKSFMLNGRQRKIVRKAYRDARRMQPAIPPAKPEPIRH